jgi:hypothetical protein
LWLCCHKLEEVRGRDSYTLKNISTVVEFSLSLPGTDAAVESVFRLEVSTVKSIDLMKHHFHNYKCPEFHEFLLRNCKILEQIHSSAKYISAPTLPTQIEEVHLTHAAVSTSSVLISFKGKYQFVHPYKMYRISPRLWCFSAFSCVFSSLMISWLSCLSFSVPTTNFAYIFPFLLLTQVCFYLLLPTK